jgi:hypothetical protein
VEPEKPDYSKAYGGDEDENTRYTGSIAD